MVVFDFKSGDVQQSSTAKSRGPRAGFMLNFLSLLKTMFLSLLKKRRGVKKLLVSHAHH
jgi:hypothetical protein